MADPKKSSWLGVDFQLMKILWPYFYRSKVFFLIAIILLLSADFVGSYVPLLIQRGVDVNIASKDHVGLQHTVILLVLMLLFSLCAQVVATYMMAWVGQKLLFQLRSHLLDKVFRLPKVFFDKVPTGQILTHITNDVESVRNFISVSFVGVISSFAKLFFIAIFMFILSPWLALVTILTIPLFAVGTLWFKSSIRDGFRSVRQANSDINTRMVESLNGHREIILFQHRKTNEFSFDTSNKEYLSAYKNIVNAYAIYLPMVENITHFSTLVVLVIAHFGAGKILLPGEIFAFFSLINMFFRPLREMAEEFNSFQGAMAAVERIKDLLEEDESITSPESSRARHLPQGNLSIQFESVQFYYQADKPVLRGLDLNIEAGATVALVGNTGAGKSTITHLINRLYDIQDGDIQIGEVSVKDLPLSELRGTIATIPQDVSILSGSFLENVRLFDQKISDESVSEAIHGLGIKDFVDALPQGIHTDLGEAGLSLSEGEKQLIAFARAWVKRPRLLILDEATANVDSRTEKQLELALQQLKNGRTTIIIAHRLSTIQAADKICVLQHGQLAESGSHDQLMLQKGSYYKLYRRQSLSLMVEQEMSKQVNQPHQIVPK